MRGLFSKKDKYAPPPPASAPPSQQDDAARSALFGNRPQQVTTQHNPYGAPPPQQQSGYGGYGGYGQQQQQQQQQQQGGYGGYGSTSTLDHNKNELFAGRQAATSSAPPAYGAPPSSGGYGRPTGYADDKDRVLTAEEEEEEDVDAVKQQIRFTKQESVSSTRNALRIAAQAEETGRTTLARLGEQGERLHNTEKNLDMATSHNRVADEKARELKTLNRSMFAVHVANPLKSKSRAEADERRILERHDSERSERERTRQARYQSREGVEKALSGGEGMGAGRGGKVSLAERSKYQFEADESDDEKEREIEGNLDALAGITGRLKGLAAATGQEVDRQNVQIANISKKVCILRLLHRAVLIYGVSTERWPRQPHRTHA